MLGSSFKNGRISIETSKPIGFITMKLKIFGLLIAIAVILPVSGQDHQVVGYSEFAVLSDEENLATPGSFMTQWFRLIMDRANIEYDLVRVPGARAYQQVLSEPNAFLISLFRSPEREKDFHWIGKMVPYPSRHFLIQLKDREDLAISDLDSARPYNIGVVNGDSQHRYLQQMGFENLQPVSTAEQNIQKLVLNRIDFIAYGDGLIYPLCQRTEISCSLLKPVLEINKAYTGGYLAANIDTNPEVLKAVSDAFEELVAEGARETLFNEIMPNMERMPFPSDSE
ncbi:MAG: hypothetical protein COC19_04645 [SAR86 cluster bacterium]|uniref:Uncharacterized protein n=1 Tax=SAR86 cluster bacterium TaxID=2030880 RepID=A0A2A4MN63_9GAMM|nr:MAG: hypothetical protein COC19_04645 [SAR86 cluster bacterium]